MIDVLVISICSECLHLLGRIQGSSEVRQVVQDVGLDLRQGYLVLSVWHVGRRHGLAGVGVYAHLCGLDDREVWEVFWLL